MILGSQLPMKTLLEGGLSQSVAVHQNVPIFISSTPYTLTKCKSLSNMCLRCIFEAYSNFSHLEGTAFRCDLPNGKDHEQVQSTSYLSIAF